MNDHQLKQDDRISYPWQITLIEPDGTKKALPEEHHGGLARLPSEYRHAVGMKLGAYAHGASTSAMAATRVYELVALEWSDQELIDKPDRVEIPRPRQPLFLDPLVIDRALDKYRKGKRTLLDTARYYGLKRGQMRAAGTDPDGPRGLHSAVFDAHLSVLLMYALADKYPTELAAIHDLQTKQQFWFHEWKTGINRYWKRTGKDDRVEGGWPI